MIIKKIGIDRNYSSYDELKNHNVVAQGWNHWGDMACLRINKHFNEFKHSLSEYEKSISFNNFLNNLFHGIKAGDIILAYEGNNLLGIAEMPERFQYEFNQEMEDYKNCLYPVEWIDWHEFCNEDIFDRQGGQGVKGIENCNTEVKKYIEKHWEEFKEQTNLKVQPERCEQHLEELEQTFDTRCAYSCLNLKSKVMNDNKITEDTQLLLNVKNLIFTGAPGTGKTYRAIEIAKRIVAGEPISAKERLREILDRATDNIEYYREKAIENHNLLKAFQASFPISSLKNLSKEQYCIGNPDFPKQSFCWWIERGLKPLGYYFPGTSKTYLIFYNKEKEEYSLHGFARQLQTENSSLTVDNIMSEIAEKLSNVVKNKSIDTIFGESFQLKLLNSYYPDEFFPINSRNHLVNVVKLFDLSESPNNLTTQELNKLCVDFYNSEIKSTGLSINNFAELLYINFNIKYGETFNDELKILTNGEYEIRQFHPSYDYTDFVEGLRPYENESGNVGFRREDGAFKALCKRAVENPAKKFVMIIDEINRGEMAKIFGELFAVIDPEYRGKEKMTVKTQYQNLVNDNDCFADGFYVPENVYIIATMNDIDRNVECIDFAMRRRFTWKEITAKESYSILLSLPPDVAETAEKKLTALNKKIFDEETGISEAGLSKDYHIGAAYFKKIKNYLDFGTDRAFELLWHNHIKNLLTEYLRGIPNSEEIIKALELAYRC